MSKLANKPGVYRGFSGEVNYKSTTCIVKNANFMLLDTAKRFKNRLDIWVKFNSGTVVRGSLYNADIHHCVFEGATICYSVFRDGVFNGDFFSYSYWYDGEWSGRNWMESYDRFGRERGTSPLEWDNISNKTIGIADEVGYYKNFTGTIKWKNSNFDVEDAEFELIDRFSRNSIIFNEGTVTGGTMDSVIVSNGVVKNVQADDIWWWNGVWDGGTWQSGNWFDGTWKGGHWNGGFDEKGHYHREPPNTWDL